MTISGYMLWNLESFGKVFLNICTLSVVMSNLNGCRVKSGLYTPTKVLPERYWGKTLLSLSYLLEKVWRNSMTSQKYQYWNNAWTDRRIWCEGKLYSETIGHLTFFYLILLNMDYGARIFIMFQLYPQYTSWRGNYLSPASILLLFHYIVFLPCTQNM